MAAMVGLGGLGANSMLDRSPAPTPTEPTQYTQQQAPDAKNIPVQARSSLAGLKPNPSHAKEAMPFVPANHTAVLIKVAKSMGITSKNDLANFLGQCSVETADWQKATEQFTYSSPEILRKAYTSKFQTIAAAELYLDSGEVALANRALANKNGNGDEASGDGWRYRGRGFIHLTGRELYAKAGQAIHPDDPTIYLKRPDLLSSNPTESAKASAWYFITFVGKGKTAQQTTKKVNPAGLKAAERDSASKFYQNNPLTPAKPAKK